MKILTLIVIYAAVASASKLEHAPRGRGSAQALRAAANHKNDASSSSSPLSREQETSASTPDEQAEKGDEDAHAPSSIAEPESKKKITSDQELVAKIFKLFKYPFGNTVILIITMVVVTLALVGLLKKEQELEALHEEAMEKETYYNQYYDYYNNNNNNYNHYNYNPNYNPHYNPNYRYRSLNSPFNFSYRGMVDLAQRVYTALQKEY